MTERNEMDLTDGLPEPVSAWLNGDRSPATTAEVEEWLAESPENRVILDDLIEIWELSHLRAATPALQDLQHRLDALEVVGPDVVHLPTRRKAREGWRIARRMAAVLVVGIGLGLVWPHLQSAITPREFAKVVVPAGARTSLELPGGVSVQLNYATELAYHSTGDVRDVYLNGEAFFTVPDGAVQNLRVHTEAGLVRDIGTEFNVHARDGRTAVTVTDGLVELESPLGKVALVAGQASSVRRGHAPEEPMAARLDAATSWMDGQLILYDEPLARVAKELEHRYGVPFEVDPPLRAVRINARIDTDASARDALEAACISIQARCFWQDDRWRISR